VQSVMKLYYSRTFLISENAHNVASFSGYEKDL
jgi:hypothetical protein